ncbi:hypothetical protein A2U01_0081208, partial [Trifolium medium]|nr:hypothetical protein [Trifolium medium]
MDAAVVGIPEVEVPE